MSSKLIFSKTQLIDQPDSFEKGHAFENYIVSLFNNHKFQLIHWRSDKRASNGMFPLSSSYPDLELVFRGSRNFRFAIECKWREKFNDGRMQWANSYQICMYEDYQNQNRIPVFIAIGIGGEPSNPGKLFITPLNNLSKYTEVFERDLIPYNRNPKNKFFYDTVQLKLF
jgi:hypothetical protein